MHLHKQKLTKYFRGHYIIMVGVTNFKELGVTFSCSVFAAFFWELPKNFPHVWLILRLPLSLSRFDEDFLISTGTVFIFIQISQNYQNAP